MAAPMQSSTIVLPNITFVSPYFQPVKRIKTHDDLPKFQKSNTMKVYMDFLEKCSTAVTDKKVSDTYPSSPVRESAFLLFLILLSSSLNEFTMLTLLYYP